MSALQPTGQAGSTRFPRLFRRLHPLEKGASSSPVSRHVTLLAPEVLPSVILQAEPARHCTP